MKITFYEAFNYVAQQSPASTPEMIHLMARELQRICEENNEPKERAWLMSWEGNWMEKYSEEKNGKK